uniref:Uncharacterized protein n=1 Tax=Anguilla anguilla TaxID=7936 RepID=A0A0E9W3S6_ANGAN
MVHLCNPAASLPYLVYTYFWKSLEIEASFFACFVINLITDQNGLIFSICI